MFGALPHRAPGITENTRSHQIYSHTLATSKLELSLEPIDNTTLSNVCGALDGNLRQLETAFSVKISRRMAKFTVSGDASACAATRKALERFRYVASHGAREVSDEGMAMTIAELKLAMNASLASSATGALQRVANGGDANVQQDDAPRSATSTKKRPGKRRRSERSDDASIEAATDAMHAEFANLEAAAGAIALKVKRADLAARTPTQLAYLQNIQQYDITFGIGPAGTGKTYLAVACAVDAFERDLIKRIVLVRPAVEAGERLGFLPGDLIQKVDPYLRPLYDALFDLMGLEKTTKLMERGMIEVAPLAFMRGRTLNNAFIILDEAQNTTPEQMKMFLTRIGFGTKTVVTGDPTQIDLQKNQKSGIMDAQHVLAGVAGIAFTRFTSVDVVRHPLVQKIVTAYERQSARDNS
jgi:phosphate starvation-inducible protein PhoH and related proteins